MCIDAGACKQGARTDRACDRVSELCSGSASLRGVPRRVTVATNEYRNHRRPTFRNRRSFPRLVHTTEASNPPCHCDQWMPHGCLCRHATRAGGVTSQSPKLGSASCEQEPIGSSALNCEHPRPKAPRTCGCAPTSRVVWCCHLTWTRCRRVLSGVRSQLQKRRRTRTCVGSVASKGLREERASASTRVQTHACGHTHLTHRTSEPCATCRNEAKKLMAAMLSRALAATAAPRPTPSRPPPGASHAFSDGGGAPPTRAFWGEVSGALLLLETRCLSPLPQPAPAPLLRSDGVCHDVPCVLRE